MGMINRKLLKLYIAIRTNSAYGYLDGLYRTMAAVFIGMSVLLLFCKLMTTTILEFAENNIKNLFNHPVLQKVANMTSPAEVVQNETINELTNEIGNAT